MSERRKDSKKRVLKEGEYQRSNGTYEYKFATRCCEADVSPKSLQQILGHADYQTSMDIYAEPTDDLGKTGIIRLNERFGSADHLRLLQKVAVG